MGGCKFNDATIKGTKLPFVIPSLARNQVAVVHCCNSRHKGRKAHDDLQYIFFPSHLIPHSVRNDKRDLGADNSNP